MKSLLSKLGKRKWVLVVCLVIALFFVSIQVPFLRDHIFLLQINKVDNSLAEDVSFDELKVFLDGCYTVKGDPDRGCAKYAQDLHNEAEAAGIRCAVVILYDKLRWWVVPTFHVINAFETIDRGKVYVDAGLGYAYEPRQCGIAEQDEEGIYHINLKVGEMEIWHGSYKTIEPKYVTENLGRESAFWVCW
jgi:hypothetical protein